MGEIDNLNEKIVNKNPKKESRIHARAVHVTIHKLKKIDYDYWVDKAKTFRSNVSAVLVGFEENHEDEKGLHAHIVIQFTTRHKLSRQQFVKHFESDTIHISAKPDKDALITALGYVSKTGNTRQYGAFMYRGVELDANPEVYKFQYQVKTREDGIRYFHKVIKENLKKNKNIIKNYVKRDDAIGIWLQKNQTIANTLHKLAYTWYLDYQNAHKTGIEFQPWMEDKKELRNQYQLYLVEYPKIFKKNLPKLNKMTLEEDYNEHAVHDLGVISKVVTMIKEAIKYGSKRPLKALNLYIWSATPSFGKTRLLNFLDKHFMSYRLPDDQWYVDYENNMYQMLVSDEAANFLKTKSYSHLKHIFEGQKVEFDLKGREKIFKEDNPLIILADNVSFDEIMTREYKGKYSKDVMATRVIDLELKSRATLHFLLDWCMREKTPSHEV